MQLLDCLGKGGLVIGEGSVDFPQKTFKKSVDKQMIAWYNKYNKRKEVQKDDKNNND